MNPPGVIFKPILKTLLAAILLCVFPFPSQAQIGFQLIKNFGFPALSTGSQPYNQVIIGTDGALYGTTIFGGSNNCGVAYRVNTNGTGYQVLHTFSGSPDGKFPESELLQASDGMLYGTTYHGGLTDDGTIFRVATNGTGYTVLRNLSTPDGRWPFSGLIEGREDGFLYGTTQTGGGSDYFGPGTVFKMSKDGSVFTILCVMNETTGGGSIATLCEASDGLLYGTTLANSTMYNGTVFRISRSGGTPQMIHGFTRTAGEGLWFTGRLVQGTDGLLYGTSKDGGNPKPTQFSYDGCGTIFRLNTSGNFYQQVFLFPTSAQDGYTPYGAPFFGQDGRLYGTTSLGGANSNGILYAMNPDGGSFTVLHSFTQSEGRGSQGGVVQAADGTLFGTAINGGTTDNGTVFRITTNGAGLTVLHNFISPNGGDATAPSAKLTISSNLAFGTASSGASANHGAVFQINLNGSNYSFLHEFTNGIYDGSTYAGVIKASDGCLYGTLPNAGSSNAGVVFKLTTNGTYSLLHEFGATNGDGLSPQAELLQARDGMLYGTTQEGGTNSSGTIFKISTNGSGYAILHHFDGSTNGAYPGCPLIQAPDNLLYGTASGGGTNGDGTVYRLDTNGLTFQTLYTFQDAPDDATQPSASLLLAQDGLLYGTARGGGSNYAGAIFRMNLNGTGETVIYSFNGSTDGESPQCALIQATNGLLYGTTPNGGSNGDGVAFSISTNGTGYMNLRQFAGPDGSSPQGALALAPDGTLFGVVQSGAPNGYGAIYQLFNAVTITSINYTPASVLLQFIGGIPAQSYSILATSNLTTTPWSPIGSSLADTNGMFQYTDPNPTNHPIRFYRSLGP